jgi:HSP20 family protein
MSKPVNPFDELDRLFERMQENVEEAAQWWEQEPFEGEFGPGTVQIDLEEREEELVLTADFPGFETDDIDVTLTDRTLRLEAEREETAEEEREGEFVRRERRMASVARSVPLPESVEEDAIEASYQNGVLTVTMPKREPVESGTEIEIE